MSKSYSLSEFAARYDFNPEYLRQCCRQQEIGKAKRKAFLPAGFHAEKIGGRWRIKTAIPAEHEDSIELSESACIEGLVLAWHGKAMAKYRKLMYFNMFEPPKEMQPRVLEAIGVLYAESVGHSVKKVELLFDDMGNCQILIAKPSNLRELIIDIDYRFQNKQLKQIAQHFLSAWFSEFKLKWDGESRDELQHQYVFQQISPKFERDFSDSCLHCGREKQRKRSARYCNESCRERHSKWVRRVANSDNLYSAISKQLKKTMAEVTKRLEKTDLKAPLNRSSRYG